MKNVFCPCNYEALQALVADQLSHSASHCADGRQRVKN